MKNQCGAGNKTKTNISTLNLISEEAEVLGCITVDGPHNIYWITLEVMCWNIYHSLNLREYGDILHNEKCVYNKYAILLI